MLVDQIFGSLWAVQVILVRFGQCRVFRATLAQKSGPRSQPSKLRWQLFRHPVCISIYSHKAGIQHTARVSIVRSLRVHADPLVLQVDDRLHPQARVGAFWAGRDLTVLRLRKP